MTWLSPDSEFKVILAAAEAAGVRVHCLVMPDPPSGVDRDDFGDDWPLWARTAWPGHVGLDVAGWSTSPTDMGIARAGEVVWVHDCCHGGDGLFTFWQALLHEVAHAATARVGQVTVGDEDDASAWEWVLAAAVFGPASQQARYVRQWASDAGVDKGAIRQCKSLGAVPNEETIDAACRVWRELGRRPHAP